MVRTNQAAMMMIMKEKFTPVDTPDTYKKRIIPFVQGIVFNDILPYLYSHLPKSLEMSVGIANPADLNAFFDEVKNK